MSSNTLTATAPIMEQTLTPAELEQARLYLQEMQCCVAGA